MTTIRRALLPALLALPLVFAACGGGDSDEDTIRGIIADGSSDPASVCNNATDALLEQLGGKDKCLELAKSEDDGSEDPAKVNSLEIDGDKATAKITSDTGPSTLTFVKVEDDWKLESSK